MPPAPKPTAIERAEGYPGKHGVNRREPKPGELSAEESRRACPKHLPPQYRKWWRYYAPILAGIRVLTEADLVALELLARTSGERVEQEAALLKAGPLYKSQKTDYVQISPIFSIVLKLRKEELTLLREFGMTPRSRTGVNVAGPINAVDPIEMAMG